MSVEHSSAGPRPDFRAFRLSVILVGCLAAGAGCGGDEEEDAESETIEATEPTEVETAPPATEAAEEALTFEQRVAASEPLSIQTQSQTFGDRQIHAVPCTMQGREMLGESGMDMLGAVEVMGDRLYTLTAEGQLLRFTIAEGDGCVLALDASFGEQGVMSFEHEIESLDVAGDTLLAANNIFASWRLTDGTPPQECGEGGSLTFAPDGSYALKAFANSDTERIVFSDAGCTSEPYSPFVDGRPFSNVNTIGFLEEGPIFGGVVEMEGENEHIAIAYDGSGEERFRFGSTETAAEDGFGWFHAIESCGDDICVLDSNYRRLSIWTNAGVFRGTVDLSELFGLRYPWIANFAYVGDGNAYFAAAQERGDSDVYQGLIYRVVNLPGGDGTTPAPVAAAPPAAEPAPEAAAEPAPEATAEVQPEAAAEPAPDVQPAAEPNPAAPRRDPRAQVESAVRSAARGCYQRLGARGQVSVLVNVGTDGRVITSRVAQNQTGNLEVGRCISGPSSVSASRSRGRAHGPSRFPSPAERRRTGRCTRRPVRWVSRSVPDRFDHGAPGLGLRHAAVARDPLDEPVLGPLGAGGLEWLHQEVRVRPKADPARELHAPWVLAGQHTLKLRVSLELVGERQVRDAAELHACVRAAASPRSLAPQRHPGLRPGAHDPHVVLVAANSKEVSTPRF